MTTTKKSFLTSLVALLVLFSMFVGTTFAWFTDIASSNGNVIQAGTLDIALMKGTPDGNGNWTWTENKGEPIFDYDKWEPGYTTWAALAVENHGSLAARWQAKLSLNGTPSILADVIEVYSTYDHLFNPDARPDFNDGNWRKMGTVRELLENDGMIMSGDIIEPNHRQPVVIALHMREDAGNAYQGLDLGATFDIQIMATQATFESDSFDDQYDKDAEWPYVAIKYHVGQKVEAEKITVDAATGTATLNDVVTVGNTNGDIHAEIPAGVTLAQGATELTLKVESMETPTADVELAPGEVARSIDVHIDGVAEDNTTPMLVSLPGLFSAGLNDGNAKIFHVEDDGTKQMTQVYSLADLDAHNEFYYDTATGDVVIAIASFSEITPVENDLNPWNGKVDFNWYVGKSSPYYINTADELAGFGAIVDGGYNDKNNETGKIEGWVDLEATHGIKTDTFEDKVVRLGSDIDMGGTLSFNPIGYSYSYKGGQVFKGTFDGGKYDENGNLVDTYTISNLYINGWDLGLSYSMAGGGFFASVEDATIQNVTFRNADIVMECIEQGVVAGLAAGNCTFENINIYGCSVANYQRATGGVVGEVNPYRNTDGSIQTTKVTHTFSNIEIDAETVIGSLWGDFDAPVGGVVGAKWDDDVNVNGEGVTQVEMNNVSVACRLDVYNDVTSTYQWYAYRRAGMLIGNTEEVADDGRTAKADFLTCTDVTVYYGDWVDYHYCEFNNHNSSWPFVRVEAGENCTAFSNPRWGVPNDINGVKVTPERHPAQNTSIHQEGDDCYVELTFNQLYGGGQGVYGQETHTGVATENLAYTITYVNDNKVLEIVYVLDSDTKPYFTANETAQELVVEWVKSHIEGTVVFGGWMNAGSTKLSEIPADNTDNIVLYPYFTSPYTASFVDQQGNILAWCFFNENDTSKIEETMTTANDKLPDLGDDFTFNYWEVRGTVTNEDGTTTAIKEKYDINNFTSYKTDVTLYPYYLFKGAVQLIPVDNNNDGETDHYELASSEITIEGQIVVIPDYVNGVPVKVINSGAFTDGKVADIYVPNTITTIGDNAFCANKDGGFLGLGSEYPQIQIYFDGTKAEWDALVEKTEAAGNTNWDDNIGHNSVVVCLEEPSEGYYLQTGSNGILGSGAKVTWEWQNTSYTSPTEE